MFHAANRAKRPEYGSRLKAQEELEKIEEQIEQLESAAGNNQDAQQQLQDLHDRVDALRRQMSGAAGRLGAHRAGAASATARIRWITSSACLPTSARFMATGPLATMPR